MGACNNSKSRFVIILSQSFTQVNSIAFPGKKKVNSTPNTREVITNQVTLMLPPPAVCNNKVKIV
jgi:hypothetical protein